MHVGGVIVRRCLYLIDNSSCTRLLIDRRELQRVRVPSIGNEKSFDGVVLSRARATLLNAAFSPCEIFREELNLPFRFLFSGVYRVWSFSLVDTWTFSNLRYSHSVSRSPLNVAAFDSEFYVYCAQVVFDVTSWDESRTDFMLNVRCEYQTIM